MSSVTILHSRWPKDEFIIDRREKDVVIVDDIDNMKNDARSQLYVRRGKKIDRTSGLWGTMMVIVGGEIRRARFDHAFEEEILAGERRASVEINNRAVHLVMSGDIVSSKLYTTVERYRNNDGSLSPKWDGAYVRLQSRPEPYGLRLCKGSEAVMKLRAGHDGAHIRIDNISTAAQKDILIHEAPHVGWVVGCIGPRPYGDRRIFENVPGNPSDRAFREIAHTLSVSGRSAGRLFVLVS